MFKLYNKWFKLQDILKPLKTVKKGKELQYYNVPCVFDIEASSFYIDNDKYANMYCWVFGINGKCIRGRTWDEFINVINEVIKFYNVNLNNRLIVYIHNLSYEFQWFKHYFEWYKIFSIDARKPIYAITETGIEFRCSFMLSGYNLETVGDNLTKYKVQKLVGDLDYDLIRHSETPLTDKEWGYVMNDGLVVMAYIQEEIERMGDITKLPLTKTGYVRLKCKDNCLKGTSRIQYNKMIKRLTLNTEEYEELKRAYIGGFTHANHNHVDKVNYNVASYDFTSSYPAVMLSEKYPMSSPRRVNITNREMFYRCLKTYCCMFDIEFVNIKSKVNFEHYISRSKCYHIEGYSLDNGRVIEASVLRTCITELDFEIISKMYEWEKMRVTNFYTMNKGYLPKELIEVILELYKNKTTLKGVEDKVVEYLVSKGMLNSIYGMCVTDICRDEYFYNGEWGKIECNKQDELDKYNSSNTRFLYYPWGVWVTAYARYNLFTGILECGDDYIYADTDSVKIMNKDKHKEYFDNYNENIVKKINQCLRYYNLSILEACPKTIKGVKKPIGVWDYEGSYDKFKTLGAKRYMYEIEGDIHITISGVKKSNGEDYLRYKYKTIDNIFKHFTDHLLFPAEYKVNGETKTATGKLTHTYIDDYKSGTIVDYLGNEGYFSEMSSVHMEKASYEMSLDFDFWNYVLGFDARKIYI